MKRVYKQAVSQPDEAGEGYVVMLDAKRLNSPGKQPLVMPTASLAQAVAEEWAGQGDEILPHTMPLTRLVATATDQVAVSPEAAIEELMRFADTDLLCYRAEEPEALKARQAMIWQPLLDWVAARFGADLAVTSGIMPRQQPEEALTALRKALASLDPLSLTALMVTTSVAGSLVIGLALLEGRISAEEAFAASQLDESFQIEQWGEDWMAAERRAALKDDLSSVARLLELRAG